MDITPALRWLESLNVGRAPPARLLPAAVMLRAAALATAESAELNGFWEQDGFHPGEGVRFDCRRHA